MYVTCKDNKYFSTPLYVTLLLFTYISTLHTQNLGNKRLISPSLEMSKNVLLLLLLKLLLQIMLLMLYFYFAAFTTCPLLAYKYLSYIHTLFHSLLYWQSLYSITNKILLSYIVVMPSGYDVLYSRCSALSSATAFISQRRESVNLHNFPRYQKRLLHTEHTTQCQWLPRKLECKNG